MKEVLVILTALTMVGCSSSGKKNTGARGSHADWHWNNFVGVGHRSGYGSEDINRYSINIMYKDGDRRSGSWWSMDECGCHAWNLKLGKYSHEMVFAGNPVLPDHETGPAWLSSHESLHSYIESSPEFGGNPLPPSHRRGGSASHPDSIFSQGKWRSCRSIVQGRWPALVNKNRPVGFKWLVIPVTDTPPVSCDEGVQANNWHN